MSLLAAAILGISSLVTSFISGILGMAGGMILMGILLALLPLPAAMMMHGITQLASNAWRALLWRDKVDWRIFRGYLYGAVAMGAVFAVAKFVVSKPVALIAMGLTPFAALASGAWRPTSEKTIGVVLCGANTTAVNFT